MQRIKRVFVPRLVEMGRKRKKESKPLKVGDYVFAKVRGFRAWPARVLQEEGKMYHVYFYGTCNIAKVGFAQLYEYAKSKARLGDAKKKPYGLFREAMVHVEQSVANPDDDNGYFQAKAELISDDQEPDDDEPLVSAKKSGKVPFIHITGDSE